VDAALEGRAAGLRDLVALLRTLEEDLARLHSETSRDAASASPSVPAAHRFRLDPFRVQIAIRSGIAVCAAFLVPMVLGWEINTMVAPMAFMIAATPTRGGVTQTLVLLAGVVLFAWLLADLALVFVTPHVGRMPLALVYPAAIAGSFAYVRTVHPQLAILPSIGGLVAILPIYSGLAAPTDVYGTYSLVCYMAVALGTGWLATRLLWPATAARLFRERLAAQLELCLGAFRGQGGAREFISTYTRQSAQIGPLNGQASHEPVEDALDDARRGALLGLVQNLFDSILGARGAPPAAAMPALARAGDAAAPLREALERVDQALLASLQATADVLRGRAATLSPSLAEARDTARARLDEMRSRPELRSSLGAEERREFLVQLDSRGQLVTRQLAIEGWLAEWRALVGPVSRG
jgi:hypothetical protein